MAEPIRSGSSRARFNYADDIGILEVGHTATESAAVSQGKVVKLLK